MDHRKSFFSKWTIGKFEIAVALFFLIPSIIVLCFARSISSLAVVTLGRDPDVVWVDEDETIYIYENDEIFEHGFGRMKKDGEVISFHLSEDHFPTFVIHEYDAYQPIENPYSDLWMSGGFENATRALKLTGYDFKNDEKFEFILKKRDTAQWKEQMNHDPSWGPEPDVGRPPNGQRGSSKKWVSEDGRKSFREKDEKMNRIEGTWNGAPVEYRFEESYRVTEIWKLGKYEALCQAIYRISEDENGDEVMTMTCLKEYKEGSFAEGESIAFYPVEE